MWASRPGPLRPSRGQPGRDMHAVGDVADGNLLLAPPGPQVRPHLAADHAMQVGDGIGGAGLVEAASLASIVGPNDDTLLGGDGNDRLLGGQFDD